MTPRPDESTYRDHAERVLREVCEDFDASLEAAANGSVSEHYAAVPSWWAAESSGRARPATPVPSWCIDAATARRLLSEIHGRGTGSER